MLTLTYGFKKPQTNDKGNLFFPALEFDIQQVNDHTHNGTNSSLISTTSVTKSTQAILSANWSATSGGHYRQEITLPAGFTYASTMIRFVINGGGNDGDTILLSVGKGTAANKYYVYINDNSLALTALYV